MLAGTVDAPEAEVAQARRYYVTLLELIGRGMFGKVYRGAAPLWRAGMMQPESNIAYTVFQEDL